MSGLYTRKQVRQLSRFWQTVFFKTNNLHGTEVSFSVNDEIFGLILV